jgi:hypothetical protein
MQIHHIDQYRRFIDKKRRQMLKERNAITNGQSHKELNCDMRRALNSALHPCNPNLLLSKSQLKENSMDSNRLIAKTWQISKSMLSYESPSYIQFSFLTHTTSRCFNGFRTMTSVSMNVPPPAFGQHEQGRSEKCRARACCVRKLVDKEIKKTC